MCFTQTYLLSHELSKIFSDGTLDYTEINEDINAYYNGNGSNLVQRVDGRYSERINLGHSEIAYIININPQFLNTIF